MNIQEQAAPAPIDPLEDFFENGGAGGEP